MYPYSKGTPKVLLVIAINQSQEVQKFEHALPFVQFAKRLEILLNHFPD